MIKIADFEAMTLLDYPGVVASVVFIRGCNLRCRFCHNPELVTGKSSDRSAEFFSHIRKTPVEGIAVTGGEPLYSEDIFEFLYLLREEKFKIKLDTNGFFPERLEKVLRCGLADYVAIDIKGATDEDISFVTRGSASLKVFMKSAAFLKSSGIPFEYRLTVWKNFDKNDAASIANIVGNSALFLQKARSNGKLLDKRFSSVIENVNFELVRKTFEEYLPVKIR